MWAFQDEFPQPVTAFFAVCRAFHLPPAPFMITVVSVAEIPSDLFDPVLSRHERSTWPLWPIRNLFRPVE